VIRGVLAAARCTKMGLLCLEYNFTSQSSLASTHADWSVIADIAADVARIAQRR